MRQISTFLLGVVVGGVLVFGAQRYHLVRSDSGFELVPKLTSGYAETYVDVRGFEAADWEKHKELAAAIVHAKKENLLTDSASAATKQGVGSFLDHLKGLRSG